MAAPPAEMAAPPAEVAARPGDAEMAPARPKVAIEVISDTVCPWCYVGQKRLQQATAQYPGVDFEVSWKAFELFPEAPKAGVSKREFLRGKPHELMARVMKSVGVDYSVGGLHGSTFDSHRLAEWAKKFGPKKQDALMTAMFDRYFSREQHISDPDVLVAAAEEAGLPGDEARKVLADESAFRDEVRLELGEARRSFVSGVPRFTIHPPEGRKGRPYVLSGAQEKENFELIFDEWELDSAAAP